MCICLNNIATLWIKTGRIIFVVDIMKERAMDRKKQESVAEKIPGTMDLRRAFFLYRRAFFLSFSCVPVAEKTRKNRIGQNRI